MPVVFAEIVTIGDELCRGEIVDTNAAWLAERLWDLDITVSWMTSCRDEQPDMADAFARAARRCDLVLTSGGLGPTVDDLTVDVIAELVDTAPEVDQASLDFMRARFEKAGFELTPNNMRQVRVPGGARVFDNPVGLAPGFEVTVADTPIICLPGPPRELRGIMAAGLGDRLIELREARGEAAVRMAKRIYRVFGMGESHVATALDGLCDQVEGASLHFQVKFPETLVKVVVRDPDQAHADERLGAIDGELRARLRDKMYGTDDDSLARAVGRALSAAGQTVAVAESCTGGMIGSLLTDVAGSSAYFLGGVIAYANAEKERALGVDAAILEEHGAVSAETVAAMAAGCRERLGSDWAIAVSGIAGPDGGTEVKPVGTVWVGLAGPDGIESTRRFMWPGDRERVRRLAAFAALGMLLRTVDRAGGGEPR